MKKNLLDRRKQGGFESARAVASAVVAIAFVCAHALTAATDRANTLHPPPVGNPPTHAVVLFDGSSLEAWNEPNPGANLRDRRREDPAATNNIESAAALARWQTDRGALVAFSGGGDLVTREAFGNYHLHFDFLIPRDWASVASDSRDAGGVFLNDLYEIQLTGPPRTGVDPPNAESCGAVLGLHPPRVDASKPAGEWQTMDITFEQSPGKPAAVSVWLNNRLVQDHVALDKPTPNGGADEPAGKSKPRPPDNGNPPDRREVEEPASSEGPIRIRATRSDVRFANIWVKPLDQVDHAGLIRGWDDKSRERGEKIYNGLCITCHGNREIEGTLPTSRKFWEAEFKNGGDPHNMYQTLTQGFGQMPPQPWMTPAMAYDVIHYIREQLVKPTNPAQYIPVDESYLARLPRGRRTESVKTAAMLEYERGPKYERMDFGPVLHWTYEVAPGNIAYKGIAVRLDEGPGGVSKGRAWMLYDHDTLRVAAGWTGNEFVDWRGIAFDGSHQTHTSIVGRKAFVNPVGPGWANPTTGRFNDPRLRGRDGKPYGPMPRDWIRYRGIYPNGERIVLAYTVGTTEILESPGMVESGGEIAFQRTLNIGKADHDLILRVAPATASVALAGQPPVEPERRDGFHLIRIPSDETPIRFTVVISDGDPGILYGLGLLTDPAADLARHTRGAPARWTETIETAVQPGPSAGAFAVDVLGTPDGDLNPWRSWMRLGGFDFFDTNPDRAAVCTWMGDVWIVNGLEDASGRLEWKRVAAGLFQPLGVKIVDGVIFVTCRDQLVELRDLNHDGEMDLYRNFNNDHQVTEHFHEFAMGLQRGEDGAFYYAKSARHALPALVPHHGTLLRVSPDGQTTDIVATGFRAANGVCLNPDGTFFVTDQEGHWTPKNRINRVKPGGFYGNMMAYHTPASDADSAMELPLVWITNEMDRSPGELVWIPEDSWGPLGGGLINLSYGTGRLYLVPHEQIHGQMQGGVVPLPLPPFPTGVMRGRFHPNDGQLYACGLFAWAGNQHQDGGFYRVRYTGGPAHLPVGLHALRDGMILEFSEPLDPETASNPGAYRIKAWDLNRTSNYGSRHRNERDWDVTKATVVGDGRRLFLRIPSIQPTWGMEIRYELRDTRGNRVVGRIHNTIHKLDAG